MSIVGLYHLNDFLCLCVATKIYAHQRTQDFTVLIAILCASQSSCGIYGWCPKSIKLLHDGKNPSKGVRYSDFLYFCHVRVFVCLFCDTKISEISDMAKSWETFVAQLLIKTIKVYCCGNKVHNSIIIEGNTSVRLWRCGLKGIALVSIGSSIPNAISPSYAILAGVQQ